MLSPGVRPVGRQAELFWSVLADDGALRDRVFHFWTGFRAWPRGFLLDPDSHRPLPAQVRRQRKGRWGAARLRLVMRPLGGAEGWGRRLPEASTCSFTLQLGRSYERCARTHAYARTHARTQLHPPHTHDSGMRRWHGTRSDSAALNVA